MIFRLDILIALSVLLSFFWINASLFGIGSSMLLFVILLSLKLLIKKHTIRRKNNLNRKIFWTYSLYSSAAISAMLIAGNTTSEDIRYWISILLTSLIFIIFPNSNTNTGKRFVSGIKLGVFITAITTVSVWLFLVVSNLDLFIIRSHGSHDTNTDWQIITLFSNANLAARVSLLLLVFSLYFSKIKGKYSTLYLYLSLLISLLIISTLSRANIISLIVIWGGYGLLLTNSSKKVIFALLFSITASSFAVLNKDISNRFLEISNYSFSSDENRRSRSWQASLNIIRSNPLLGSGKSNELDVMEIWGSITRNATTKTIVTHGGFLKIGVYTGLVSLTLMIIVFLRTILLFFIIYRSKTLTDLKLPSAMGLLTMIALIPMNIGADGLGLFITWFVVAFFLEHSSN